MNRQVPGERWYRRLLRLYPRDFRDDYGREMVRLYRDRRREEGSWSLWSSLALDLLRTAPSEHLDILREDLRHALRSLRRTPVITTAAILTLALGVGASTAVFSVVHATLLRSLPYPEPDRLVELFEQNVPAGSPQMRVSALNYLSWVERAPSFDALGTFQHAGVTLADDGDPEFVAGSLVTASYFRVLALPPIVGRALQVEDEQRGSPRVAVLGESLWRSRFGGDRRIVGRFITIDGERHQVVGVMPTGFREVGRTQLSAPADPQILLPFAIDPTKEHRGNRTLRVVGRLRREVPIDQAREEMRGLSAALQQEFPASNSNWGVGIEPVADTMRDPQVRQSLLLLLGAVMMVFLIACANVANLLLARGARRSTELAVRTALGAGRARLVRQLLTESGCLVTISGAAGVFAAAIAQPLVRSLLQPVLPGLHEMKIDANVLGFGLLISGASGPVFGVLPALRASRLDPSRSLTVGGRTTLDPSRVRLRQTLTAAQTALATMLLVTAALLLQGFVRLHRVPLGFEPDGVVTLRISLPRNAYPDATRTDQFYEQLLTTLRQSGQLDAAAVATSAPFAPGVRAGFRPPDRGRAAGDANTGATEHIVSGDYFRVLGVPLLAGRSISDFDHSAAPPVVVVSERLARAWWPDRNPLGQLLERNGRPYEVVGVVGNVRGSDVQGVRGGGPEREPGPAAYFAARQSPQRTMTLLLRPRGESTDAITVAREAVRRTDRTLAVQQPLPLRDWFALSVASTRLTSSLAAAFAISAMLLTAVGIYGVLAFTVASRTREIGVRMAIGATRRAVLRLILRDGMTWAGGGILAGLIGALAATRLITSLLFEIDARDPATFVSVGGTVTIVALIACSIPAARATRIDPTQAIRTD